MLYVGFRVKTEQLDATSKQNFTNVQQCIQLTLTVNNTEQRSFKLNDY